MEETCFRDMVEIVSLKDITQGSIYNGAYHPRFEDIEILGLVITARCDIANKGKVKSISYLPVIPLQVWMEVDFPGIIYDKNIKNTENNLEQILKKYELTVASYKSYGKSNVLSVLKTKRVKEKDLQKIEIQMDRLDCLESKKSHEIKKLFTTETEQLIDEISKSKVSDLYLIDNIEGYGPCFVLLREVSQIEIATALQLGGGIYAQDCETPPFYPSKNGGDIFSIVAELKSPYIEHLMQRFSENFIRIGTTNPHPNLISEILK